MRRLTPLFLAIALIAFAHSTFAQSVNTKPVGFVSTNIGAGKSAALSFPLNNLPKFTAGATAVTATTIQTTGAGWAANAYAPFGTNPHVVRMLTGTLAGRHFRIGSHTADTLTITGTPNLTGAAAGDLYEILAVNTLASVFGADNASLKQFGPNASTDKLKTNPDNNIADNVLINVGTGWLTFWNTGTQWQRVAGGTGSQNNTALLPEQGILFIRHDTNALPSFSNTGAVPFTNLITDLPANKSTLLANRFPIDMKLTTIPGSPVQPGLDLDSQAGWNKNIDPNLADNVLINVGTGWLTFWHTGTQWQRVSGGTGAQNPTIKAGTAVLLVRRAGSNIVYNQALPYVIN
jgi:uncharacterized protein (TIGR02597 family)